MIMYAKLERRLQCRLWITTSDIQRLMSDRKMFGREEDLSVFAIPGGRCREKQRVLSANIKL